MFRAAIFAAAFAAASAAPYSTRADSIVSPAGTNAAKHFDLAETSNGGMLLLWRNDDAPFTMHVQAHGSDGAVLSSVAVAEGVPAEKMAVAALGNGGFVALWSHAGSTTARVFDANSALVVEVPIHNSPTSVKTDSADITSLSNGGFAVTWEEQATALSGWCVYVQSFTAAGATSGSILQVSDTIQPTETRQYYPSITNIDSSYVVTYAGETNVYARFGSSSSLESTIAVNPEATDSSVRTRCASKIANWWSDTTVMTYTVNMGSYYQLYLRDVKNDNRYSVENSLSNVLDHHDTAGFKASGQRGYIATWTTGEQVRAMVFNYWGSVGELFIVSSNYVQTNPNLRVVGLGGMDMDAGVVYQTTIDNETRLILTRLTDANFGPFSSSL